MPQLSPMMGIVVFVLTNAAFFTLVLSVRASFSVSPSFGKSNMKSGKSFRSFS